MNDVRDGRYLKIILRTTDVVTHQGGHDVELTIPHKGISTVSNMGLEFSIAPATETCIVNPAIFADTTTAPVFVQDIAHASFIEEMRSRYR